MRYLLTLLFVLLCAIANYSQTKNFSIPEELIIKADSLLGSDNKSAIELAHKVLSEFGSNDKYLTESSIVLGIGYKNLGKYDSSLYFSDKGLKKALKISDTISIIKLYSSKGVVYYLRAEYLSSANSFKNAVKFYNDFGYNSEELSPLHFAKILNNVASAYIKTGLTDSALTYFIKSYEIRKKNQAPKRMLIVSKLNIGSVYLAVEDFDNGEKWIDEALKCATETKDSSLMEKCYTNLGIIFKKKGDTVKAVENYKNSLVISKRLGNYRDQAIVLQNLAMLSQSRNKFTETYDYLHKALRINNKLKANNSGVHIGLSNLFLKKQVYDSSVFHSKKAIELAKKNGDISYQIEGYKLLYKVYKLTKLYSNALNAHEKYVMLEDSVMTKENREYIQNLKTEFETEKKEEEIAFLKKINESEAVKAAAVQSKQKLIIISALLSLILVIVLAISIIIKRKKDKKIYAVEKQLLETDLKNKDLASKELQTEITFKTKQLTTHALNMMQRNKMLTDIREKLQGMSKKVKEEFVMEFKYMVRDINRIQKTEKDWDLFKKYFESVNKDFNRKLAEINSGLSTNDYRLAALISLNLNIKETAAVLNITPNSVKLARHRLRKKLNLDTGEDIYTFLSKL